MLDQQGLWQTEARSCRSYSAWAGGFYLWFVLVPVLIPVLQAVYPTYREQLDAAIPDPGDAAYAS